MSGNYVSCEQLSGWRCVFRRVSVAVGRHAVRSIGDRFAILIVGLSFMVAVFNSAGPIGSSRVLADRADGRLCDVPEGF